MATLGLVGRRGVRDSFPIVVTDPTRIYRMPEDQVVKRGTTVQLECRVKHDPSLKLTVSWLKDDEPLYIGNRCLLSSQFLTHIEEDVCSSFQGHACH